MSEGTSSAEMQDPVVEAMRMVCLAQDNASMLLRELRGKCHRYGVDADFLKVQAAFVEARRVASQTLATLQGKDSPEPKPEQAMAAFRDAIQAGELERA